MSKTRLYGIIRGNLSQQNFLVLQHDGVMDQITHQKKELESHMTVLYQLCVMTTEYTWQFEVPPDNEWIESPHFVIKGRLSSIYYWAKTLNVPWWQ